MSSLKVRLKAFGFARLIILLFLLVLCILMPIMHVPIGMTLSQSLVRVGINLVLSLAMVPGIIAGTGMNFALPIGVECGLIAGMISLQFNMTGVGGVIGAILISIPISIVVGYLYALLINRVPGNEMMVSTYMAFSIVALMSIGWIVLPFSHPGIVWPIGNGLRTTITLEAWYDRVLNRLFAFNVLGVDIPVGLILACALFCVLVYLFMNSYTGILMRSVGENPNFAKANGVSVNSMRTLSVILSMVLGGIGIIIYAQGFGFYQLYSAPEMMAFPAIAAVLIGGATPSRISIGNVVLGTLMFQSLLTIAVPVANAFIPEGNMSEVVRTIISNGIILYALSRMQGGKKV